MARKFLRKHLPHPDKIKNNRILRIFGRLLHQPNLWHLNRRSVSRAMLIGLFWTVFPTLFQTIPGTACAILARANLPLTLLLVWLTNPITFPPVLYGCYRFGQWLLGIPPNEVDFEFTWQSVETHMEGIWQPLFAGSLTIGAALGLVGYFATNILWRWNTARRWKRRHGSLPHFDKSSRPD